MARILYPESLPAAESRRLSNDERLGLLADVGAAGGLRALSLHHEVLAPGRRQSPAHWHSATEEAVFVVSGRPTLYVDGAPTHLGCGSYVVFAPGDDAHHSIANETTEPVVMVVMAVRAEGDVTTFHPQELRGG